MVRRSHGDHGSHRNISRVGLGADLYEDRGFSGAVEVVCEGRGLSCDTKVGWWVMCVDLLLGVGGLDPCIFLEVLCLC